MPCGRRPTRRSRKRLRDWPSGSAASAQVAAEAARAAARKAHEMATQLRGTGVSEADRSVVDTEAAENLARQAYHDAEEQAREKWADVDEPLSRDVAE